ncbi:MAG: 4Fe-4S binding protein [Candidatus Riflebacteria bacterium]|nr:4Fe-4S binding protein [Candidatus Riflebacteria bacterium]
MLSILRARWQQGHRTISYPDSAPLVPDRLRGLPAFRADLCRQKCAACIEACPTEAITNQDGIRIDLGRCIFCNACVEVCPSGALNFTNDHRLAVRRREHLTVGQREIELAAELNSEMMRIFGRSLKLRQVSSGGCNGCEVDVNVLTTVVFDLSRFGINIVASPRHADGLIVTGPITTNMKLATLKTYAAVPAPKLVIAVGACAISGGVYRDHPEQNNGITDILPVNLYIPGCPPHPITILDGLLRLLGRVKK